VQVVPERHASARNLSSPGLTPHHGPFSAIAGGSALCACQAWDKLQKLLLGTRLPPTMPNHLVHLEPRAYSITQATVMVSMGLLGCADPRFWDCRSRFMPMLGHRAGELISSLFTTLPHGFPSMV